MNKGIIELRNVKCLHCNIVSHDFGRIDQVAVFLTSEQRTYTWIGCHTSTTPCFEEGKYYNIKAILSTTHPERLLSVSLLDESSHPGNEQKTIIDIFDLIYDID